MLAVLIGGSWGLTWCCCRRSARPSPDSNRRELITSLRAGVNVHSTSRCRCWRLNALSPAFLGPLPSFRIGGITEVAGKVSALA